MINEDFCSFEVAKLLKEKGFNEKCRGSYHSEFDDNDNPIVMLEEWTAQPYNNDFVDEGFLCSAPTHQMAMKWLREVYKLEVRSTYDYDKDSWWGNINPMFEETDENTNVYQKALRFDYQGKSYEEAVEAALKYCLENLI